MTSAELGPAEIAEQLAELWKERETHEFREKALESLDEIIAGIEAIETELKQLANDEKYWHQLTSDGDDPMSFLRSAWDAREVSQQPEAVGIHISHIYSAVCDPDRDLMTYFLNTVPDSSCGTLSKAEHAYRFWHNRLVASIFRGMCCLAYWAGQPSKQSSGMSASEEWKTNFEQLFGKSKANDRFAKIKNTCAERTKAFCDANKDNYWSSARFDGGAPNNNLHIYATARVAVPPNQVVTGWSFQQTSNAIGLVLGCAELDSAKPFLEPKLIPSPPPPGDQIINAISSTGFNDEDYMMYCGEISGPEGMVVVDIGMGWLDQRPWKNDRYGGYFWPIVTYASPNDLTKRVVVNETAPLADAKNAYVPGWYRMTGDWTFYNMTQANGPNGPYWNTPIEKVQIRPLDFGGQFNMTAAFKPVDRDWLTN